LSSSPLSDDSSLSGFELIRLSSWILQSVDYTRHFFNVTSNLFVVQSFQNISSSNPQFEFKPAEVMSITSKVISLRNCTNPVKNALIFFKMKLTKNGTNHIEK